MIFDNIYLNDIINFIIIDLFSKYKYGCSLISIFLLSYLKHKEFFCWLVLNLD